ncbi:MAG: glycosidase [Mucilaginibacter polytrichastri]|nr:glycosidase [Mucilaginibacter polytrichastri]
MKKIFWPAAFFTLLFFACNQPAKKTGSGDWTLGPFTKVDSVNPILRVLPTEWNDPILKKKVAWEGRYVYNPAAVVKDDKIYLLYRAEDTLPRYAGTSRIGLAWSTDGLHFTRKKEPVLFPDNDEFKDAEWEGGIEDPRVVEDEKGTYFMNYTAYDGKTARLFVASSTDLEHWKKHGSVFQKFENGKYAKVWSKSGSVICEKKGDQLVAAKIKGKYWMYWGESNIYLASSDNLIDWEPVIETDESKREQDTLRNYRDFRPVFKPRPGKFDSYLCEPGPPAVITDQGIVFIYNSRNNGQKGDTKLPEGTYAAGQVLLDKNDPMKVLDRTETYFMKPDKPYEITGQVNNVCFLEGLASYKGKWFLYYGTADEQIAVAVADQK